MHAPRLTLIAVVASLAVPAGASAQLPIVGTPTPGPTGPTGPVATPTPPPAPAQAGKLRVAVAAPLRYKGRSFALRGQEVKVTGSLKPAAAGQRVLVRLSRGKKTLDVGKARTRADGTFAVRVRLRQPGRLTVRAVHKRSKLIKRAESERARLATYSAAMRDNARSPLVGLFQARLVQLRYAVRRTGVFDAATRRAVLAYRTVNGLARTFTPSAKVVQRVLAGKGGWKVRHPNAGHHVEVDLSRQALALIDGRKVVAIYHTSSGKPSTPTVRGHYRFYSKTPGTNSKGMVYSSYFIRGYAIHGYAEVPTYAASHGCLRVPIPNAVSIYNWINLGDEIFVEA